MSATVNVDFCSEQFASKADYEAQLAPLIAAAPQLFRDHADGIIVRPKANKIFPPRHPDGSWYATNMGYWGSWPALDDPAVKSSNAATIWEESLHLFQNWNCIHQPREFPDSGWEQWTEWVFDVPAQEVFGHGTLALLEGRNRNARPFDPDGVGYGNPAYTLTRQFAFANLTPEILQAADDAYGSDGISDGPEFRENSAQTWHDYLAPPQYRQHPERSQRILWEWPLLIAWCDGLLPLLQQPGELLMTFADHADGPEADFDLLAHAKYLAEKVVWLVHYDGDVEKQNAALTQWDGEFHRGLRRRLP